MYVYVICFRNLHFVANLKTRIYRLPHRRRTKDFWDKETFDTKRFFGELAFK